MFSEKAAGFFLGMIWSTSGVLDPAKVRAECRKNAQESTTTWWCKQHKIDAEEETDLQQDTVQRTRRASDTLLSFGFGRKKNQASSCNWCTN